MRLMNQITTKTKNAFFKAGPQITATAIAASVMIANTAVHADTIDTIAEMLTTILSVVCFVMAGIFLVIGFVEYGQAMADDGNGAEKKKATGKWTAAAVLATIGVLITTTLGDALKEIMSSAV